MSIKQRGKNIGTKVVSGSKTVGRDTKRGVVNAGARLAKRAKIVGRDVRHVGRKVGRATERGVSRASARLRLSRQAKDRASKARA